MITRYGFSSCLNGGLIRPQFFKAAAAEGFECVELSSDPGHLHDWLNKPGETRAQAEAEGVHIQSVHSPEAGWFNNASDEAARQASVQTAISCFTPAKKAGAEVVVVHPTYSGEPLTAEAFEGNKERAMRSLAELAEAAAHVGVRLAVENLPARGAHRPGALIREVLEMIDGLGDHVGVCIDAGHSNSNGQDPADEVRLSGERVFAVHIQDNDGRGEDQHLLPGQGTTNWSTFIKALDEIGYEGGRILEIPDGRGGNFEQTLSALAGLRDSWKSPLSVP